MPEILVIVVIIGILMAIAAPSWLSFLNARQLNAAQDELFQAIRQAQVQAAQTHQVWQASFREPNGLIEFAVHTANAPPIWQASIPTVHIDSADTTLATSSSSYRVQFGKLGQVNGQLGRLTLVGDRSRTRRCVVVSTLLGAVRKGQGHAEPDASGRYCY
jgi:type II secretory pathway pseudopilin PulG